MIIVLFYLLWTTALARVLLLPTRKILSKAVFGGMIFLGAWLIIGALMHQAQVARYEVKRKQFETQRNEFVHQQKQLDTLYASHPTSRDVLLRLTALSFQTGDHEKGLEYAQLLRSLDPNNDKVKNLLNSVQ